jgi:multidrug efflux pump subunit AcrA (membrane-fusion protein)
VEEDSSNLEYYGEVKEREEKALAERTQLEQKLKLQRVERQKALSTAQAAEDQARSELAEIQVGSTHELGCSTESGFGAGWISGQSAAPLNICDFDIVPLAGRRPPGLNWL